jgi:Ca2+-binding EF-hand superfamily protein
MRTLLMACVVVIGCSSLLQAAPPKEGDHGKRPDREEMKKRFMEKYDANKDGKIDDKEKEAIRAEWSKHRHHPHHDHKKPESKASPSEKPKCCGKDGKCCKAPPKCCGKDGKCCKKPHGHSEWAKGHEEMKKKFMEKYDANKDGKIDDKEKEAIKAEWSGRFEKHSAEFQKNAAGHIMIELDKNEDGKLNADEVPEKYRKGFGDADKNEDGYIDKAELTKVLEAAHEKMKEHIKERTEEHRKHDNK